jgi:DedD protein
MDRRVKERLIGASILVAFVVLVVPELLSGPKPGSAPSGRAPLAAPEPTRNVTVDLATSKAPANSEEQAAATDLAPAATTTPPPPTMPTPTMPLPAPPPTASVETPAASPISAAHGWAVQLGSFANRANSDGLVHQLKAQGFSAYVLTGGTGPALRYRVRVGPLADRQSADRMAAKLKSLGHASSIVAPVA